MARWTKNTIAALFVTIMLQGTAASAGASCTGRTIQSVNIDATGKVLASFSGLGNHLTVCSVETPINSWGVYSCRALHATLVAARLSSKPVTIWFDALTVCPASINDWTDITANAYRFYHLSF